LSAEATTSNRRDWNWDSDGKLEGLYVETRQVTIKNGPSAGKSKLIFDFHVGLEDERVSVWEATVLRSKFREELTRRGAFDFDPGERITITPLGMKEARTAPTATSPSTSSTQHRSRPQPSCSPTPATKSPARSPTTTFRSHDHA
jgi:hypothetical protein